MRFSVLFILTWSVFGPCGAFADTAKLMHSAHEAAQVRFDMIEGAQAGGEVIASYYVFDGDPVGYMKLARLRAAARRGAKVMLLIDGSCTSIPDSVLQSMLTGGIEIYFYNPVHVGMDLGELDQRMHDKYLIVDGKQMLSGSANISEQYSPWGQKTPKYLDREVLVTGKSPAAMRQYFFEVLKEKEKIVKVQPKSMEPEELEEGRKKLDRYDRIARTLYHLGKPMRRDLDDGALEVGDIEVLHDKTAREGKIPGVEPKVIELINQAKNRIVIENPYVVLTDEESDALVKAAERGVEVTIYTNSAQSADHSLVVAGYELGKTKLVKAGVKMLEWTGKGSIHAKTMVIDREVSLVSTFNLDYRSARINLEVGLVIRNPAFAKDHEERIHTRWGEQIQVATEETFGGLFGECRHLFEVELAALLRKKL